ncbi:unnamed protein product [Pleuronectes platessa]|uniref:Uncharacterized protein n=1 Tax=Pleuronectes platessa TaxID=8262 RepID=A0A9N7TQZ7_PLEPL|nr:unnamed protein product [Pleuronectes platessa]
MGEKKDGAQRKGGQERRQRQTEQPHMERHETERTDERMEPNERRRSVGLRDEREGEATSSSPSPPLVPPLPPESPSGPLGVPVPACQKRLHLLDPLEAGDSQMSLGPSTEWNDTEESDLPAPQTIFVASSSSPCQQQEMSTATSGR